MAQNPPHRHHFVPAFYLRRWINPEKGQLVEYSRIRGRIKYKWRHPNATGYEDHLYSFNDLPEDLAQHIETEFFKRTDDIANKVLTRLLSGDLNIFEPEQRNGWSRFLFSLQLRHPTAIAELRETLPRVLEANKENFETTYQEIRKPTDPPTYLEYQANAGPQMTTRIHLWMLQSVMDNVQGGQRLNDLKWATLNVKRSKFKLMTSDWPLQLNADAVGLVVFPVSPILLFLAAPDLSIIKNLERRDPSDLVRQVNIHVVGSAQRYVFAADTNQSRFIENRMSSTARTGKMFPSLESQNSAVMG